MTREHLFFATVANREGASRLLPTTMIMLAMGIAIVLIRLYLWGQDDTVGGRLLAPFWEEPVKIGLGLFFAWLLSIWRPLSRSLVTVAVVAAALVVAVYEHYTPTYLDEGAWSTAIRLASHAAYPVLGLMVATRSRWPDAPLLIWLSVAVGSHLLNNTMGVLTQVNYSLNWKALLIGILYMLTAVLAVGEIRDNRASTQGREDLSR